ncbi:MAG: alpha/beta fold hydrolase, partial [Candidatus Thorarchaeota archaeon]
ERLISLMLIDTSSNTLVEVLDYRERTKEELAEREKNAKMWEEATEEQQEKMREADLKITVEERMEGIRREPGPYLFKMVEHPDGEKMLKIYEGFLRRADRRQIHTFMRNFYTDPDPRIEQLRQIKCPTLVMLGEYDVVFTKPSEIMAREIPDVRHVIMPGIGHMTAIEDPEGFIKEILDFLDCVKQTGKASW